MYKLTNIEVQGNTINATVDFTLSDGTEKLEVVVPLVSPKSKKEVIQGIENREATYENEITAIAKNIIIKAEMGF